MFHLLIENLIFLVLTTVFLFVIGWMWKDTKPFYLPLPLPTWFKSWLAIVLLLGVLLPLIALVIYRDKSVVLISLISYLLMLGLQILAEKVTINYHSCVWVTIPCLYLPYRIWQLYQGLMLLSPEELWVQRLLWLEIGLWIFNYFVHLSQLPRLLRWEEDTAGNLDF